MSDNALSQAPARAALPAARIGGYSIAELALAVGSFGIGTGEFAIMGLLPQVADSFAVSVPDAGVVISSYAIGVVVGAPLIAVMAARYSRRTVLLALMTLFALGNLASAIAGSFGLLIAARFLAGLPHGAYFGVAALVAAGMAPANQQARAIGRVMMGLTVATLLGTPLAAWFGQALGWRAAFAIVGAISMLTVALVYTHVPKDKANPLATPLKELAALGRIQVWLTLGICAIGCGGMFVVFTYITPALTESAGVPLASVPMMLSVFGAGMILGNIVGSRLADWALMPAIGIALVFNLVAFVLFYFTMSSPWLAVINVLLIGGGFTVVPGIQMRLIKVSGDAQTLAAALSHSAFNIANAIGAWLGGVSIAAGYGWTSTGVVGAIMGVAGIAIFLTSYMLDRAQAKSPA
ncbi:DHA1 family inner membrane transport protein [Pararhizobium capsulatum DSM 1112]|uniref:DHA1 family inner membrane transport protein n=1 Tax=Pararhizobium capsulatum DSM 1112 TaxID=1121113 RepID=A0ABU0BLM1_9HYPH|nr:MFS transporter [Pararhizobium capsulatum]MDQ0318818.1 DHA1 family inner membrane transport protein [Pararhizobium capsulatum DSM 1112]